MDILAMLLMVFPVIGLFASGVILILMLGIGSYSVIDWLKRKPTLSKMPGTELEEKFSA